MALTHYADPVADDQLRTYNANFRCYDMVTSGEHAVYIEKR